MHEKYNRGGWTEGRIGEREREGGGGGRGVVCCHVLADPFIAYRLIGRVVKASASRAEGPGFESPLRREFFGVESYQ